LQQEIMAKMRSYRAQRRSSQPQEPSAGSVFRNPPEASAGRLIEEAGLKGLRCGDAAVSTKHANFIVNLGQASAGEVWSLIQQVRERVFSVHGVELTLEIERLGEWA
jgi:UDP-N-acetylmuramate dehydrogenase